MDATLFQGGNTILILKRNTGETIRINDDITIVLTNAGPGWARIGIVAPRSVPVHRGEIYDQLHAGKRPRKHIKRKA